MIEQALVAAKQRLIFAMDVPTLDQAASLFYQLENDVGLFKVGLELLTAAGLFVVNRIPADRIMIDQKLHDIPETVARAARQVVDAGVSFFTVHSQQKETLERVVRLCEGTSTKPVVVTVLTSMTQLDLIDAQLDMRQVHEVAWSRMCHAYECGVRHFVCSAQELALFKTKHQPDLQVFVPGIRSASDPADDQKRTATAGEAIRGGADYLVVGRPIRNAPDPVHAAQQLVEEIALASNTRDLHAAFSVVRSRVRFAKT